MSRAIAREFAEEGKVRINGRRVKKGTRVHSGDVVTLEGAPTPRDFRPTANPDLDLVVLHEDEHVVVIDKPAKRACHPLRNDETDTVANALVARFPEMQGVGYADREPGILHRLDLDTSGVLVCARSEEAFHALRSELRAGRFDKRYLALCEGEVSTQTIDLPIANEPGDKSRVRACLDERDISRLGAKHALTEVLRADVVMTEAGVRSLVSVRARFARRHQVRVHLATIGHPLVGDERYGGPPGLDRHFLHASTIIFPHPSGGILKVKSKLPSELAELVGELSAD